MDFRYGMVVDSLERGRDDWVDFGRDQEELYLLLVLLYDIDGNDGLGVYILEYEESFIDILDRFQFGQVEE